MDAVLLWALPDDWVQFELLAPDLVSDVYADMTARFAGSGVDESALTGLIIGQLATFQDAAENGILLIAACARKEAGPDDPPPGLSLTLALGNLPSSSPDSVPGTGPSAEAAAFVSSALPLRLSDDDMTGFLRESRRAVTVPGLDTPLDRFQVQAFVVPAGQPGTIVITVTTFDPDLEDDARAAARGFAQTLTFVTTPPHPDCVP